MPNEMGARFLAALTEVAEARFGAEHPFVKACREAAATADPTPARIALEALAPAQADALLAQVHQRLREDGGALLGAWSSRSPSRPH